MNLLWSAATRHHDWLAEDRAVARRLVAQVKAAGLIGEASWYSIGDADRRVPKPGMDVLRHLLDQPIKRRLPLVLGAGGDSPFAWELAMLLSPPDDDGEVRGHNRLNLWTPIEPFAGRSGSDRLVALFRGIHGPAETEFAYLHPHPRSSQLEDVIDGAYGAPLTYGTMFTGVFWATLLGKDHLALFDLARLQGLDAYRVEWTGDEALLLQVSADVADATTAAVESRMLRLTEVFRAARLPP
ncbi:hypothetical protein [Candidatus Thiodictyon syntrophicum]|jgi:hypothetical protein|uniref:Uncharacterized protein n=1 Tax=Candidatus Thiodictyon syntrophicum TaxID=1166950 RepID=A0A2K8U9D8_9GAMM|nr:hypothetical protein [Candidatus Thiodictyon syntrophicum]AUB82200.1 hypothetical protein THSYN_15415 [Candidatus Thiodictyon syntrophicum]